MKNDVDRFRFDLIASLEGGGANDNTTGYTFAADEGIPVWSFGKDIE